MATRLETVRSGNPSLSENTMMPATTAAKPPRRTRFAVGIALPRGTDGRSHRAKRFRALVTQFALELGGNDLSAADQALVKQAAHLILTSEELQEASVNGERVDADALVRVNSEARRVLQILKAKATEAKPGGPDPLQTYLAAQYTDREEPEASE
jgi:hypothetical protein